MLMNARPSLLAVLLFAFAVLLFAFAAVSCTAPERVPASQAAEADPAPSSPHEPIDMADVMKAKLVFTESIVNGLARGDLSQVAASADAMRELSERASWRVQDTVTYVALSEVFRSQLATLAADARAGHRADLVNDYVAVTNTCLACHSYLSRERQEQDMPGRISIGSRSLLELASSSSTTSGDAAR